ncbi:hypothetical protein PA0179 [Candidatus Phytoplasma australiense]|uniref:DUF2963 domain-containing protein n=1 Tax=Phytoplasma australiense TaxID=59748 RepID=B1V982_PHYAS|nr:hypothetical protein PA0179 [Candidatus Phytoplasma australiense]
MLFSNGAIFVELTKTIYNSDGTVDAIKYDSEGKKTKLSKHNNNTIKFITKYEYSQGNLIKETEYKPDEQTINQIIEFNPRTGRRRNLVKYDPITNKCIKEIKYNPNGTVDCIIQYEYDNEGKLFKQTKFNDKEQKIEEIYHKPDGKNIDYNKKFNPETGK